MRWIALCLALSGCSSVQYVPCPTIVTYSKEAQAKLMAELLAHEQPEVVRWVGDYIGLRDQVRACER